MKRPGHRLVSLDVFRGLSIAAMILVNNPAAESHRFTLLRHSLWNGCRPADAIFPAFLFIAGVSISLSQRRSREVGTPTSSLVLRMGRRAALLFALGVLLNALPYFDWEIVRVPGVLQRVALAYLGGALVALSFGPIGQGVAAAALLALYWALLTLVPVPGYGAGVLTPEANLAAYLDRMILGTHMAHRMWDPEGLLGTLPSIASVLTGTLAGVWIMRRDGTRAGDARIARGLLFAGLAAMAAGLLLGRWLPINKSLWTSSFAVYTSGISAVALAACMWLVDVRGIAAWTPPFLVFGTNPILAYWLSSFAAKMLELVHIHRNGGRSVFLETYVVDLLHHFAGSRPAAALLYSATYVALWCLLLVPLYRREVFIKI